MNLRAMLLRWSIPIQKLMQKIHPPETTTSHLEIQGVAELLRDGDILLSREAWHFTNLFIPGYWSHAAIVSKDECVIEAIAPRVRSIDFVDWAIHKHNWCVIRPKASNEGVMDFAYSMLGAQYDYLFDISQTEKSFFCSELVYLCWRESWIDFQFRETFGVMTVTPDDFFECMKAGKAELIWAHLQ